MSARRKVSLVLAVVIVVTLLLSLAGCGDTTTTTAPPATTETMAAPVTTETTVADPYADIRDKYKGEKLIATAWSGPYTEMFIEVFAKPFMEITGAEVEVQGVWTEIPSKIKAAPADDPPFDVTIGDGSVYYAVIEDNLFLPIRPENIPNMADTFPALLAQKPAADGFGVPFDGAYAGIVTAAGTDLTKWADFWDKPELKGKISFDKGFYYSIYPAIYALGLDPREALTDPALTDQVFAKTKELAPSMLKWYESGGEFFGLLERGDLTAGYYYATQSAMGDVGERLNLTTVIPTDGQVGYIDYFFVVRGTKHQDLGEAFINFITSPDRQEEWCARQWMGIANSKVTLPDGVPYDHPPVSNEDWEAFHDYDWDIFYQDWDSWDSRWKKEILGQ